MAQVGPYLRTQNVDKLTVLTVCFLQIHLRSNQSSRTRSERLYILLSCESLLYQMGLFFRKYLSLFFVETNRYEVPDKRMGIEG
jgi:hypothetical protein